MVMKCMMTIMIIAMHFSVGYSEHSWQPAISFKTNTTEYWLNRRVLLCSIWIISAATMAGILIHWYEGSTSTEESGEEAREKAASVSLKDETWKPCLKEIHPAWLLIYRALAFFLLLTLLIITVSFKGSLMFCYYTQWTFLSVTVYFGIGSLLSIYGCCGLLRNVDNDRSSSTRVEAGNITRHSDKRGFHRIAGFWGYALQIIFQMNAGAVMLTDLVFWLVIVPFLVTEDYSFDFIVIGTHSVNAIFVLGEAALNSLVALSFFGLDFSFIPDVVFRRWHAAYSLLCYLLVDNEVKAHRVVKVIPSVLHEYHMVKS
ncbi:uncharacterized protein LOC144709611 isoform X2 [Wolffia australiana]